MRSFAYVGPGAGFVLSGSFLLLFVSILVTLLSFAAWPVRVAWRAIQTWSRLRRAESEGSRLHVNPGCSGAADSGHAIREN